jgi:hypothetical protein
MEDVEIIIHESDTTSTIIGRVIIYVKHDLLLRKKILDEIDDAISRYEGREKIIEIVKNYVNVIEE